MADTRMLTSIHGGIRGSSGRRKKMTKKSIVATAFLAFNMASTVSAYVPASPTNDTTTLVSADDFIQINWRPMGTTAYMDALSRQLANNQAAPVAGYRGALLHFQEANATAVSGTPWIALINCDGSSGAPSGPGAGLQVDAVTLALRAGAETAILYSLEAETCVLDRSFVLGNNGTLDLYVTATRSSADSIIRQFANASPETYWFNATMLDSSAPNIQSQISSMGGLPTTATDPSLFGPTGSSSSIAAVPTSGAAAGDLNYLIATVANSNSGSNTTNISTQPQNNIGGGGGGANTGLAMIILYAITGCVTLLFLIVIMSGAIRAMRHPERYGPRARTSRPGDNGRSRIGGLSQAILDTFPVVKFLSGQKQPNQPQGQGPRQSIDTSDDGEHGMKDVESGIEDVNDNTNTDGTSRSLVTATLPMYPMGASRASTAQNEITETSGNAQPVVATGRRTSVAGASTSTDEQSLPQETAAIQENENGEAGVDEDVDTSVTCPICLLDFEDGDDLRVLPCDSRHQFHDACVVPWLLNVSSLCPLCRLDLAKDREPSGDETVPAEDATTVSENERPTRPRASSILASSFRQLLPTAGSSNHRQSRQAIVPEEDGQASTGNTQVGDEQQQTQTGQGAPTRSRWIRYVEQRRQRVRARTLIPRRDQPSSSTAPPADS